MSPHNNTPETPSLHDAAALDASTKELLYELSALSVPFDTLTNSAIECYDERLKSDAQNIVRNNARKQERADTESQLEYILERASHLKQRQEAIISRIPSHLLTHANTSANLATVELDGVLLEIEDQRLTGIVLTNEHIHDELAGTEDDIESIQDPNTRADLKAALDMFRAAFWAFKATVDHHDAARYEMIKRKQMDLDPLRSGQGTSPASAQDEVDDSPSSSGVAVASSSISELNLGSPVLPIEQKDLMDIANGGMFCFDRGSPPSLQHLANWLGLDNDVEVALLLNTWPIQHAFEAHRAAPGESCVENPERLKMILPLFTYPRDTLRTWQAHIAQEKYKRPDSRLDIHAALFANHVVRYLERSSDVVAWEPVSGNIANLGDYELSRCRWAVVLQMFWFMEKAFGKCVNYTLAERSLLDGLER
ncbi:hypothetical protein F4803DRAFT_554755 [Xylaria telfairii]|nr:hypothetical protein F4803DRAFT_554755 [Xylaria telfairii]